jgi:hypothetical protein
MNYVIFSVISTPLEYVRPELFDEVVDRHDRSYVSAVLRVRGRLGVVVPTPLGLEDRQRTPRADAPDQLEQRCSGSYLQGVVFGSDEASE